MSKHNTKTVQGIFDWVEVCECQIEQLPEKPGDRLILSDFDDDCPNR